MSKQARTTSYHEVVACLDRFCGPKGSVEDHVVGRVARVRPRRVGHPRRGNQPPIEPRRCGVRCGACSSTLRQEPIKPALLILGDMNVPGKIKSKPLRSLTERLQVAKDGGANRACVENERNFLDVSAYTMDRVDPIFFGDAAMKSLGVILLRLHSLGRRPHD